MLATRLSKAPALPRHICPSQLPDFLIISPPKTGSTWLAAALGLHPEIFVPDFKEAHFFNHYLADKGWEWYADQFRRGRGLTKGESTPGYCGLPPGTIRLIRRTLPDLKLIYLMREPVARAWSTAKHTFRHQQSTFENHAQAIDKVDREKWEQNFLDVKSLRSGHYQAHLQNWLAVFSRDQVFIDFYETIGTDPEGLLTRIFTFLGVKQPADFAAFSLSQRRNEGLPRGLSPEMRAWLQKQFAGPTRALADYLQRELGIAVPPEWQTLLQQSTDATSVFDGIFASQPPGPVAPPAWITFARFEKARLKLAHSVRVCEEDFYGYLVAFHKGEYIAVARELGPVAIDGLTADRISCLERRGLLFQAPVLVGVKAAVAARQLTKSRRSPRAMAVRLLRSCVGHARRFVASR